MKLSNYKEKDCLELLLFVLFSNFDFEYNNKIAHFTALCNFLVEIDFSNSDGSDFLRDLLGQRSMMRERDLSGPAEQNGLIGPGLTLPHITVVIK